MIGPVSPSSSGSAASRFSPGTWVAFRWFTDPVARDRYASEDHDFLSRMFASGAREVATLRGPGSRAARLSELLLECSAEFRDLWAAHEVGVRPHDVKRFVHREVGRLDLHCQTLIDPGESHYLHVHTAVPGSESYAKLELLEVVAPVS